MFLWRALIDLFLPVRRGDPFCAAVELWQCAALAAVSARGGSMRLDTIPNRGRCVSSWRYGDLRSAAARSAPPRARMARAMALCSVTSSRHAWPVLRCGSCYGVALVTRAALGMAALVWRAHKKAPRSERDALSFGCRDRVRLLHRVSTMWSMRARHARALASASHACALPASHSRASQPIGASW